MPIAVIDTDDGLIVVEAHRVPGCWPKAVRT
jgi:hypothetical protein